MLPGTALPSGGRRSGAQRPSLVPGSWLQRSRLVGCSWDLLRRARDCPRQRQWQRLQGRRACLSRCSKRVPQVRHVAYRPCRLPNLLHFSCLQVAGFSFTLSRCGGTACSRSRGSRPSCATRTMLTIITLIAFLRPKVSYRHAFSQEGGGWIISQIVGQVCNTKLGLIAPK